MSKSRFIGSIRGQDHDLTVSALYLGTKPLITLSILRCSFSLTKRGAVKLKELLDEALREIDNFEVLEDK